MGSFLDADALNHIKKHLDRFPLIKLDRIETFAAKNGRQLCTEFIVEHSSGYGGILEVCVRSKLQYRITLFIPRIMDGA